MISYNHLFHNIGTLEQFILKTNLQPASHILVQAFLNTDDFIVYKKIKDVIQGLLPHAKVMGVVSNKNILPETVLTNNSIIGFTVFETSRLDVFSYILDDSELFDVGVSLVNNNFNKCPKSAVILSNMSPLDFEKILDGINSISTDTFIAGGLITPENKVFTEDTIIDNGFVGYTIDNPSLIANTFTNNYYMPIGKEHTITDCEGNVIKSIDNMFANEFHAKYLGLSLEDTEWKLGEKFPLMVKDESGYIPKPVIAIDSQGPITTSTSISIGDKIHFGYPCIKSLIDNNLHIYSKVFRTPIETTFLFSSAVRIDSSVGNIDYHFIDSNIKICGLVTEAEILTNNKVSYLSTGNLNFLTLSENKDASVFNYEPLFKMSPNCNQEHLALLSLIENTSSELNLLNQTLENQVEQKTIQYLNHYYTDELTSLPNLNKLTENIQHKRVKSLALIDITAFININNFYGNYIGSKLLLELANLMTSFTFDSGYTIYRIHSDIFAISTNDVNRRHFSTTIKHLQASIHSHCFLCDSLEIYITTVTAISYSLRNIYENTSMTLEYAKGQKSPYLIYAKSLKIEDGIKNNLIWTTKIRTAIKNDCIVPYFQPIYNNQTKEIDRYEVLVRLIDEDSTVYTPNKFLDIAKKANLYKQLTKIVIKKAFDCFSNSTLKFSINLSSEDIIDKKIRNYIYKKLEHYPNSNNVIFEIVESESIENYDQVKEFINICKQYGVQIAIDDFGTGFSNFLNLFELNVDIIKIDGSIIQQVDGENTAVQVTETIVDLANRVGVKTVAEFVSDKEIFLKINKLGISFSQGYYVSKPLKDIV